MKYTIGLLALFLSASLVAQKDVALVINHELNGQNFAFNQTGMNAQGQVFQLDRMEYYLSRFTIIHDGGQITAVPDDSIFLVSADDNTLLPLGNYNVTTIEGIKFHVGIYDPVNHEDPSQYSVSHPLGPKSPSMHWGWSAGYRFLALEGVSGSALNQTLELHALGDANYFETTVMTGSTDVFGVEQISIYADYAKILTNIDIDQGMVYHGSGNEAVTGLQNTNNQVFRATSTADLTEIATQSFKVFPIPSFGALTLTWSEGFQPTSLQLMDASGKMIWQKEVESSNEMTVNIESEGTYFLVLMDADDNRAVQKVIIRK